MKKNILLFINIVFFGIMMLNSVTAQINTPNSIAQLTPLAGFQLSVKGQTYIYHNAKSAGVYKAEFSNDGKSVKISLGTSLCGNPTLPCEIGTATLSSEGNEIRATLSKNRVNYAFTFVLSGNNTDKGAYLSVNHSITSTDGKKTGFLILNKVK